MTDRTNPPYKYKMKQVVKLPPTVSDFPSGVVIGQDQSTMINEREGVNHYYVIPRKDGVSLNSLRCSETELDKWQQ